MKRLVRNINASSNFANNKIMFSPADIVALLSDIEQLKDCEITVNENADGLQLTMGDYMYELFN